MATVKKYHFTLGPVQGFVAQARKTRDLWAGSFLLSYLAGQAMAAVIKGGGRILFPTVHEPAQEGKLLLPRDLPKISDHLLKSLLEVDAGLPVTNPTSIGSLPNRFLAEIPASLDPGSIAEHVRQSWYRLAGAVWDRFLDESYKKGKNEGQDTKAIWQRQVEGYWEISWVVGEASNLLDLRKNWRDYVPTVEHGDKCTLMGNLQELSGFCSAPGYNPFGKEGERNRQKEFWEATRENCSGLDLEENERLCAIAFIKRFYPYLDKEVIGWQLPQHYYSTPYMAAMDWIALALKENYKDFKYYSEKAKESLQENKGKGIEHRRFEIPCKLLRAGNHLDEKELMETVNLNGDCLYQAAVANTNNWSGISKEKKEKLEQLKEKLKQLAEELEKLQKSVGSEPQPHYAMLLMDGDRMGALIQDYGGEQVSPPLQQFTQKVEGIIAECSGVTIYAGGDDVLAFLPFQEALRAASVLEEAYREAFAGKPFATKATASMALVFAHYNIPLMSVYREASRALAKVAKDETGRHSLAVSIWKGSGPQGTWAMPWSVLGYRENGANKLEQLVQLVRNKRTTNFSNNFLYKLDTYYKLSGANGTELIGDDQMLQLMLAEFLKTKEELKEESVDIILKDLQLLLDISHKYYRKDDGSTEKIGRLTMAGPRLVKFLADNWGVEVCGCGS